MRLTRQGFTLVELLTVLAVISVLVGLIMPAVQQARAAADRIRCLSQIRQLALGLHQYHDTHGHLPPAMDNSVLVKQRYLTWHGRILPWIEQEALWREVERAFALAPVIFDPPHYPIHAHFLPLLQCPSDSRRLIEIQGLPGLAPTAYLGVSGKNWGTQDGMLYNRSSIRFIQVTDGLSTTLLLGERPTSIQVRGSWYGGAGQQATGTGVGHIGVREHHDDSLVPYRCASPQHFGPASPSSLCGYMHFWSFHSGGGNFAFSDGSSRFLSYSADPVIPQLATRNGGETVGSDEF